MDNIFNLITNTEKDMIVRWIDDAIHDDYFNNHTYHDMASLETILEPWAEAKSRYLIDIFNGNLILKRSFKYTKSVDELEEEYDDFYYNYSKEGTLENKAKKFIYDFNSLCRTIHKDYENHDYELLVMSECIITNVYDFDTCFINLPNGKELKIQTGSKVSKILGKIAEAFNLKHYEDFRIWHSQFLNQKKLEGTLCLSIHPLDYMTMSNNDCGWDSCMTWQPRGDYCHGTVEMMNSEAVVVAYLEASDPMIINDENWSNKKWRELFIVNKDIITEVKPYPYENKDLTTKSLNWLRELCVQADFNNYDKNITSYQHAETFLYRDRELHINFYTNMMYNDFGRVGHLAYINPEIDSRYSYEYSGLSECMCCGSTVNSIDEPCCLVCENCEVAAQRCDYCDGRIHEGDYSYEVEGEIICQSCFENHTCVCEHCDETYFNHHVVKVNLLTDDYKALLNRSMYFCNDCYESLKSNLNEDSIALESENYYDTCYLLASTLPQQIYDNYFTEFDSYEDFVVTMERAAKPENNFWGFQILDLSHLKNE